MATLYRTIMAVQTKDGTIIPAGVTTRLDNVSVRSIAELTERDAIAPVQEPPLHALPEWADRIDKLERQGITRPLQLVDADAGLLARQLHLRKSVIEEWQAEAKALVMPDGQEVFGG